VSIPVPIPEPSTVTDANLRQMLLAMKENIERLYAERGTARTQQALTIGEAERIGLVRIDDQGKLRKAT